MCLVSNDVQIGHQTSIKNTCTPLFQFLFQKLLAHAYKYTALTNFWDAAVWAGACLSLIVLHFNQ